MKQLLTVALNGLTLAALYFIVASGFTLIFGLMRTVNLAHGALFLLGAYVGYSVVEGTGSWLLAIAVAFAAVGLVGAALQRGLLDRLQGQDLRQALVTIGVSLVLADAMMLGWGGIPYQIEAPEILAGAVFLPEVRGYPALRLALIALALLLFAALWLLLNRTRVGAMVRAGVDDREMVGALGIDVPTLSGLVFALGAGMAGAAGVVGGTVLSLSPGEDARYLLASLVVVIVGGMGSIGGAALGALAVGLVEQAALAYAPTYAAVFTFLIMAATLVLRPQGLLGRAAR